MLGAVAAALSARHGLALSIAISALCAATAMLVLWEFTRRSTTRPTRARLAVQKSLATVGVVLWFLSGMALLLVLLGDSWKL